MEKKFQKIFGVFEIMAFEHVARILSVMTTIHVIGIQCVTKEY